jgi:hypothetical protein
MEATMRVRLAGILLLLAGSAVTAGAQVPAGGQFQVSDAGPRADLPKVAAAPDGNFIVVWRSPDGGSPVQDSGVFARRFDAAGIPRGPSFRVNSDPILNQIYPRLDADALGRFMVTWTSYPADIPPAQGNVTRILGSRIDARGAMAEFYVDLTGSMFTSDVGCGALGNCLFVANSTPTTNYDVVGRRFDQTLGPAGDIFPINTYLPDHQKNPAVDADAAGNTIVVWWDTSGLDGNASGVFGRRYDVSGAPRGPQFQVNSYVTGFQGRPAVASDAAGNFVVAWMGFGASYGVFGQRFDAAGVPLGGEFLVSANASAGGQTPEIATDAAGNFAVVWLGAPGAVFVKRYDASGVARGPEFIVNAAPSTARHLTVASDAAGNLAVAWAEGFVQSAIVWGRRLGGIVPAAMTADTVAAGSDGNRVFEPGESVDLRPAWRNVNGAAQTFDGFSPAFTGPPAAGISYQLVDGAGAYGPVANGATVACADCYRAAVVFGGTRPSVHWDAAFTERLTPDALGQTLPWPVHIGQSFTDVPKTSLYYRDVETILHRGVTAGCSDGLYCPSSVTTREQMAAFVLLAKEGLGYAPEPCVPTNIFLDVPDTSPFCDVIEELARRGVVAGCGGGNYCPTAAVSREQMAVFVLRTLDPALNPPACTTPLFADVPASSPFCRWIEELARRGIVAGCGGGNYCPTAPVTREQMAVFLTGTFGLTLYGP